MSTRANMMEVAGRVLRRKRPAHGAHSAGAGRGTARPFRERDGASTGRSGSPIERDVNQPYLGEILIRE